MIIAFNTLALRQLCEDDSLAVAKFGDLIAEGLRGRLADLRAAATIGDLLVGRPRTGGEANRELILDLVPGAYSVWTANHPKPRVDVCGKVDWSRTTRVQLMKIEVT